MIRMKTLASLCFACSLFAVSAADPVALSDLFPDDVVLHIPFDDDQGRVAIMDGEVSVKSKNPEFTDKGVSGKGLSAGSISYNVKFSNCGFGTDATLVFWFALAQDDIKMDDRTVIPLIINGAQVKMIVARQGWGPGKCNLYNYFYLPEKKKVMSRIFGISSVKQWKPGEWHMIASTWTSNTLAISVDGETPRQIMLSKPIPHEMHRITVQAEKGAFMVDELMVFDRKLSQEELKKLHDAYIPAQKAEDGVPQKK